MCSAYPPLRHPWLDLLQAPNVQDPRLTHLPHQYFSHSLARSRCSFKKWLREGMDGERKRRRVKHQIPGLPHLSPSLLAPLLMLVLVCNPEAPSPPLHVLTPGPLLLLSQCLSCFLATLIDCYQWFLLEFVHLRFPVNSHCITQTILLKICHKTFRNIISTNTIPICFFHLFL